MLVLILILTMNMHAQDKKTPIVFSELILGGTIKFNDNLHFMGGLELNYQYKNDLFSVRYIGHIRSRFRREVLHMGIITSPKFEEKVYDDEIGILYGKRFIHKGSSISFSAGLSLNEYSKITKVDAERIEIRDRKIGFPLEISFKWFQKKKKRFKIYELFPVGKPTSFGRSIGFKIVGNVSKYRFFGIGITYGLGIHKKY